MSSAEWQAFCLVLHVLRIRCVIYVETKRVEIDHGESDINQISAIWPGIIITIRHYKSFTGLVFVLIWNAKRTIAVKFWHISSQRTLARFLICYHKYFRVSRKCRAKLCSLEAILDLNQWSLILHSCTYLAISGDKWPWIRSSALEINWCGYS